jgi:hypothetical protein
MPYTYIARALFDNPHTAEPRFTNAPVHEQFGSRTNFPSKNVSDDERCLRLRTRKLAPAASLEYRRGSVSCWLTNLVSVYERPPGTN